MNSKLSVQEQLEAFRKANAARYELAREKQARAKPCKRCGRSLTRPESLECGFGPECAELVGIGGMQDEA